MAETFSIIKHPITYKDKQYYVTVEEIDDDRPYFSYIEVIIYIKNEGKFRLFKYKRVRDERYSFEHWRGKYKELMIRTLENHTSILEWHEKQIEKKDIVRRLGLKELEDWNTSE